MWSYDVTTAEGKTGVAVFRAELYEPDYPGLATRVLAPLGALHVTLDLVGSTTGNESPETGPARPPHVP